jgi:DNA polymerase I-like protein with 3'-5' exonuclease and polymerase domains
MYQTGVGVDQKQRAALSKQLVDLSNGRKAAVSHAIGDHNFTYTPDDFRALIFKRHRRKGLRNFGIDDPPPDGRNHEGWTDETMTKCSVDKAALLRLVISPACPEALKKIILSWWRFRAPLKAKETYITSRNVEEAIGPDNRLRPGWNSCGTETMRWSCRSPNLMNLSEKKDFEDGDLRGELPDIRSMYCEGNGFEIVGADWSQQELRMMQVLTGDQALATALATGDVYSFDARQWFNLPADFDVKKNKPAARKGCKVIHLGCQYGAGVGACYTQALMRDRNISFDFARTHHASFRTTYHRTVSWWAEEHARVLHQKYSEGRLLQNRRYYPEEPPPTETANFPVQDTCGEMASIAALQIRRQLARYVPSARLIINLHDAFYVRSPVAQRKDVVAILQGAMQGPWTIEGKQTVFPIDVKAGRRWTEDKSFDDGMRAV